MAEYISPNESRAYTALIEVCVQHDINTDRVKELLWASNAEPNLTSFIRILKNLNDIIHRVETINIIPSTTLNEIAPWREEIEQLLNNNDDLVRECGSQLLAGPKGKNKKLHPLHGKFAHNPLYALLWNRADINELKKQLTINKVLADEINEIIQKFKIDFQILQWHLFFIHHSLIKDKISIDEYLESNSAIALLGAYKGTIKTVCQTARDYHHAEYREMLDRLHVRLPSSTFFENHHEALSEQLDPLARPFKTLGTKLVKETSILRVDIHRRKHGSSRKRSTAYYVEYGDNTLMSHKSPEEMQQRKDQPSSRVLSEWSSIEGWEESDLPKEEQVDESEEQILVDIPCKIRRSQREQIMAAIGLAHKRAVLNQNLPIHINLMTIDEVASVMRVFGDAIRDNKTSSIYKKAAILGISMYWTSNKIENIRKLVVVPHDAYIADDVKLAYFLNDKVWRIQIPIYKTVSETSTEQKALCRPSGEHLFLPDIWNFHSLLVSIIDIKKTQTSETIIKPFYSHKISTYNKAFNDIFKPLKKSGLRISHQRLSRDILLRLLSGSDSVSATMITGQQHPAANTARHYSTPTVRSLEKTYLRITSDLVSKIRYERYQDRPNMPDLPNPDLAEISKAVGASHCPSIMEVKHLLQRVIHCINESISPNEYHMYYTIYTTLVISYCTGYRAVRNINLSIEKRDAITETAWISDKDNKDGYHTRRVWLSPLLNKQLIAFENHRRILFATWEMQFPSIPRPNELTTPYLFFVNDKKENIVPVSSASMDLPLKALSYPIPLNSNRRFLRTELSERGCPTDVLRAFMGHWASGEEPHNPFSCLSPRHLRQKLREYLLPLQEEIGLIAITSRWDKNNDN